MNLVIQGTKNFSDYSIFLSAMRTAMIILQEQESDNLTVFSAGPVKVNNMAREFINVTERSLKSRGVKTKLVNIPPKWIDKNLADIDYFVYLCNPKESVSPQVEVARAKDVEVGIYRY